MALLGVFLKQKWGTIKDDIMRVVRYFYQLHDQHLCHLNMAHILLIPKKADVRTIGDFGPISLNSFNCKASLQIGVQLTYT